MCDWPYLIHVQSSWSKNQDAAHTSTLQVRAFTAPSAVWLFLHKGNPGYKKAGLHVQTGNRRPKARVVKSG